MVENSLSIVALLFYKVCQVNEMKQKQKSEELQRNDVKHHAKFKKKGGKFLVANVKITVFSQ